MQLASKIPQAVERIEQLVLRALDRIPRTRGAGDTGGREPEGGGPGGLRTPPGPPPRRGRVLGSMSYYLSFLLDPIGFVAGRFATYGDLYHAPNADGGLYAIRHPDHLQEVLVTHAAHYRKTHTAFARLSRVLGGGLLTSDGPRWRRHRRMIQPAFSHARLAGYAAEMTDEAVRAAARLRDGDERDIAVEMMEITLRAVCRTLFSHDVGDEAAAVGRAMATFQESLVSPDLAPGWVPTPRRRRLRRAVADLDRIIYRLIARRRAAPGEANDLLETLVSAVDLEGDGSRLTEVEVRDELVTLFLAGHETTANTLTWTYYLLSQHPEVEARLHAEIDAALGGRPPAYDDLAAMPYGEQVIKEAMRLYPPVYTMARRAHEDTEIGGYPVPRGSEVIAWIYLTHRDPRWYPEPDQFRPERFAPGEETKLPRLAYAPFGAGPRACIGKSFAMIEARLILAALSQRLRFELAAGQRVEILPRITLAPKHGMKMRVRAR